MRPDVARFVVVREDAPLDRLRGPRELRQNFFAHTGQKPRALTGTRIGLEVFGLERSKGDRLFLNFGEHMFVGWSLSLRFKQIRLVGMKQPPLFPLTMPST